MVRWCLKHGVRSAQVESTVREIFVHEAEHEIHDAKGAFSVSKVSVMTGLHRTEVSRLLSGTRPERGQHDVLNRIIGLWSTSKRYRTKDGTIKALTHEGLSSEFAALVASVSKEVTHYPILFEMERLGVIEYKENKVHLIVKEYTPQQDLQYALDLLSLDIADLAASIEANVSEKYPEPSLHLRTTFDNIDPKQLGEIRTWIMKKGAEFQTEVREYLSSLDRDMQPGQIPNGEAAVEGKARVAVTTFSYTEPAEPAKVITPKKRGRKRCASK